MILLATRSGVKGAECGAPGGAAYVIHSKLFKLLTDALSFVFCVLCKPPTVFLGMQVSNKRRDRTQTRGIPSCTSVS